MERLLIEPKISSPGIDFDPSTGFLQISGESYPENSFEFYAPIIAWIKEYLSTLSGQVRFRVSLSYLNTSSTKCMIDILDELQSAFERGLGVDVEWFYDEDNDRAKDTIEEFREDFSMPFRVTPGQA